MFLLNMDKWKKICLRLRISYLFNFIFKNYFLKLMKKVSSGAVGFFWMPVFQEFFGINDESILQEFIGTRESLLQKMKNYYPSLFFPYNKIIGPKLKSQSPKNESKPCHRLLDLFRRIILGDEHSSSPTHR